ncbi:MAG: hypothetical protein K9H64_16455, partial [Bacteroidales bacterium]|nr:hypothetical protein [Bacteroidales bacterium]
VVDVPGNPGIIWKNLTHSKICWTDPEKSKQYKIIPNFAIRTMPKAYVLKWHELQILSKWVC